MWVGAKRAGGYGSFSIEAGWGERFKEKKGKLYRYEGRIYRAIPAHRYAWEIFNGPIPTNHDVGHTCRHRHCVNPDHLYLGVNLHGDPWKGANV